MRADLERPPEPLGDSTVARRRSSPRVALFPSRKLEASIQLCRAKIRWCRQALAGDAPQAIVNNEDRSPSEICGVWRNFSGDWYFNFRTRGGGLPRTWCGNRTRVGFASSV